MDDSEAPLDAWGDAPASPLELSSPGRKRLFRTVVIVLPTCAGLVVIVWLLFQRQILVRDPELGTIRIQAPPIYLEEPDHEVSGHRYLYDRQLGWRNIPNWQATTHGRQLTINSLGLRDSEMLRAKPAGQIRILVLGDSFTWGYGVSDHEVFSEVLQRRLTGTDGNYEVINTGVSGWGTDQEYLFLLDEGFTYEPDIVVLAFFLMNDTKNNVSSKQYGLYKPVFLDTDLQPGNIPVPKPNSNAPEITSRAEPVELTVSIIRRMAAACAERNCPLVVMKFGQFIKPADERMQHETPLIESAMLGEPRIAYLDVDAQFEAFDDTKEALVVGNEDDHWNAYGHRRVAQILERFLSERGLLTSNDR